MDNANTKAFTLWELLIALVVISTGIFAILRLLNHAHTTTQSIQQEVIAHNLAREGIQAVVSLRDTNWLRWNEQRDTCWLLQDTYGADSSECTEQARIQSGVYSLHRRYNGEERYRSLQPQQAPLLDSQTTITPDIQAFALCPHSPVQRQYIEWQDCTEQEQPAPSTVGKMYRQIVVDGLFAKNSRIPGGQRLEGCIDGWAQSILAGRSIPCGDTDPKQLRFCVRVLSTHRQHTLVEYCSAITNFLPSDPI